VSELDLNPQSARIQSAQSCCTVIESQNFHLARVSQPSDIFHQSDKFEFGDWLPTVLLCPNAVKCNHVPAAGPNPCGDIFPGLRNLTAVHSKRVQGISHCVKGILFPRPRLLVTGGYYRFSEGLEGVVEGIAE
jgi:hypothetical protein